ncbi:MAG: VIT1/CCC1 transporter family protein [Anaerolineales bacterium]
MPPNDKPKQTEQHFMASDLVHDIIIGMSDGLTVPFAIAAGMSGASVSATVVVIAGLAEIAAGSISMGLGGYLSSRTDLEHYETERKREVRETHEVPHLEEEEVADSLRNIGLEEEQIPAVVESISSDRDKWVDFMMRFELGLEEPDPGRALRSALTIGLSYAVSGFIPLTPYIVMNTVRDALYVSATVTLIALFVFGFIKGRLIGIKAGRSGLQTIIIGGLAAGAAFIIARLIGG